MKLRINLEIDVSEMTMVEMAAMVDRVRSAIDSEVDRQLRVVVRHRGRKILDQGATGLTSQVCGSQGRTGL